MPGRPGRRLDAATPVRRARLLAVLLIFAVTVAVSKFISLAMKNKDITVYGDGSQTRTFCFVNDNIGSHEHRVSQQPCVDILRVRARLVLERSGTFQLTQVSIHV